MQFAGDEPGRRRQLLAKIGEAARCDIDYIQLREKDLSGRELELLAREALDAIRANSEKTKLLINSRTDIAMAVGADGVHLRSDDISVADVRKIDGKLLIVVSCHTAEDVRRAAGGGADFVVFAPVFGKRETPGVGLDALRHACQHRISVLALGGITLESARSCIEAGAAGVAGIRLFQDHDIASVVSDLRRV